METLEIAHEGLSIDGQAADEHVAAQRPGSTSKRSGPRPSRRRCARTWPASPGRTRRGPIGAAVRVVGVARVPAGVRRAARRRGHAARGAGLFRQWRRGGLDHPPVRGGRGRRCGGVGGLGCSACGPRSDTVAGLGSGGCRVQASRFRIEATSPGRLGDTRPCRGPLSQLSAPRGTRRWTWSCTRRTSRIERLIALDPARSRGAGRGERRAWCGWSRSTRRLAAAAKSPARSCCAGTRCRCAAAPSDRPIWRDYLRRARGCWATGARSR